MAKKEQFREFQTSEEIEKDRKVILNAPAGRMFSIREADTKMARDHLAAQCFAAVALRVEEPQWPNLKRRAYAAADFFLKD